jgi:hypothetical protein
MTVQEIVNLVVLQNPDWTSARVITLLNQFVQMVLKGDQTENLVYDSTTGKLPFLATTKGTYLYSLSSTYYKCKYILVDVTNWDASYEYPNNPAFGRNDTRYNFNTSEIILGGNRYRQVPVVITPAFGSGVATVLFQFDPNTTTDLYHIYGYQAGNQITSVSSALQIEERFHLACVVPALQCMIDGLDNGNFQDIMPVIQEKFCSPIWLQKYNNSHSDSSVEAMGL